MDTESMNRYHKRENAPHIIIEIAAEIFAGRDWHKLTVNEAKLVDQLVIGEYLTKTKDGFCGKLII